MVRLLLLLAFAAPLSACLWDYDTLAQESKGMPDVKAAIVGGFPRNPPLYYEMRLERVTRLLAENPDDLDAYDAAGVACDRLGRSDEAIEWMARKLAAMERIGYDASQHAQPNHRYRYLANLGTFHAHRWFKNGAKRGDTADMLRGRELIAQAIKENPDAHFGREKYQLMAMEWVIALRPFDELIPDAQGVPQKPWPLPNMLGISMQDAYIVHDNDDELAELGLAGAIEGLSGLIVMGNAWESIDTYYALAMAVQVSGRSSLAALAFARCKELAADGRRSVVEGTPTDDELIKLMNNDNVNGLFEHRLLGSQQRTIKHEYEELRSLARQWHDARTSHMETQLGLGLHPDTNADFWAGFDGNPDRMDVPEPGFVATAVENFTRWFWHKDGRLITVLGLLAVLFGLGLVLVRRSSRRRKNAPATVPYP